MELTKREKRLIDEESELLVIFKIRNLLHYLMKDIEIEDYDTYVTATELLNSLEEEIWKRIEEGR